MAGAGQFVDYYSVLQVNPTCDAKILEAAYHFLAKRYHPDRSGTADASKFNEVIEAYRVLRNPDKRAKYDLLHSKNARKPVRMHSSAGGSTDEEDGAILDAEDHSRILKYLYKKRRRDAQNAGVIGFYIQEMLGCSDERFEFHKWYLKEKGFIVVTEQGTLAITVEGVDHVISMSRTAEAEKLLIARSVMAS